MKKRYSIIIGLAVIILCIIALIETTIKIYGSGNENCLDVIAVNTVRECVAIHQDDNMQTFIASHSWEVDSIEGNGIKQTHRMGNGYMVEDENGSAFTIVAQSEWCFLFREYTITNYTIEEILD